MLNNSTAAMLYIVFTEIGGNLFASSSFSSSTTIYHPRCVYTPHIDASPRCYCCFHGGEEKVFADCVKNKKKEKRMDEEGHNFFYILLEKKNNQSCFYRRGATNVANLVCIGYYSIH